MRLSTSITLLAVSTLALLSSRTMNGREASSGVSAALSVEEVLAIEEREGSNANLCPACLQKAMHNHFPHACDRDMDSTVANERPTGATDREERCVCVAFQDLFWMKADCSAECAYTHRPKSMQYFLPASKIEGCDRWLNFETGEELIVEGHPAKDPNYKPQVYEIAPPPPNMVDDENDDGRAEIAASYTTPESDAKKAAEIEAKKEKKDIKDTKDAKADAADAEAAAEVKKDEL
ncbi:hypothetical protein BG015_009171 [Linnemannia schmuckeri]|uniref:ShKT domain-containing protein n=1 Tax=Linnemannia schmuckeri TaxID=64567 RepID=A0A9P5S5P5_9FUNG|nr:hypothetical protein BG015_009171 [Linnemannia schmuckeri]